MDSKNALPAEAPIGISLVICTRNRSERLTPCLTHAVSQVCPVPWELILVDSASTDETYNVLRRWQAEYPQVIRVAQSDRPGLGLARKLGSSLATFPILAFTDDDCYAEPDFLASIVRAFDQHEHVGIMSGRILRHDPDDHPITTNESTTEAEIAARSIVPAGFVQGANMALRAIALRSIGNFDPSLGAGTPFANEDLDVAGRINALGWRVRFEPSVVVRHHHGRKLDKDVQMLRASYDHGRGAYYAKMVLSGHIRYLRYWAYTARNGAIDTFAREVKGALRFVKSRMIQSHRSSA